MNLSYDAIVAVAAHCFYREVPRHISVHDGVLEVFARLPYETTGCCWIVLLQAELAINSLGRLSEAVDIF